MNTTSVNDLAIGVKTKSKIEMHRTLTIGDGLYLPAKRNVDGVYIRYKFQAQKGNPSLITANIAYSYRSCFHMKFKYAVFFK